MLYTLYTIRGGEGGYPKSDFAGQGGRGVWPISDCARQGYSFDTAKPIEYFRALNKSKNCFIMTITFLFKHQLFPGL